MTRDAVTRWVDELIPPVQLKDPRAAERARFVVHASMLGPLLAVPAGVAMVLGGFWPGAVSMVAFCAFMPLMVFVMRWRGSSEAGARVGLGLTWLCFTVPSLFERELDGALLAMLAFFPFLTLMMLGTRAAWRSLGLAFLTLAALVISHEVALLPTVAVSRPLLVTLMRTTVLIACTFFFGLVAAADRQRALDEVERTARSRGQFLASMSHEIRTPMNGVLGLTEAMLQEELSPLQRERLELVRRSGESLVSLINDILDFSKVEAGKIKAELADFSLVELLADVERLYHPLAAQKNVDFTVQLTGAPSWVRGDALRLRQVLNNLVTNALKFTERGEVQLEVLPSGGTSLLFAVRDTGIGIKAEALPRLFRPFEQAEHAITQRFGGSGLGLALSRQLVELMGGRLEVVSEPGKGSVFSFSLPLERGQPTAPQVTPAFATPVPFQVAPVLIVDDNEINLRVATALVQRAGYGVRIARNGQEALDLVLREPFSAVLMDCHMPVMDGMEATERIRGLEGPAARLPIFALTASALPEELAACRRSGMNDCLTKPVSFEALRRVLRQVEPSALPSGP